jgi:hypothetical protein
MHKKTSSQDLLHLVVPLALDFQNFWYDNDHDEQLDDGEGDNNDAEMLMKVRMMAAACTKQEQQQQMNDENSNMMTAVQISLGQRNAMYGGPLLYS